MGCAVYSDGSTCEKCYSPNYINEFGFEYNNKCILVSVEVANCKYYDTD